MSCVAHLWLLAVLCVFVGRWHRHGGSQRDIQEEVQIPVIALHAGAKNGATRGMLPVEQPVRTLAVLLRAMVTI